MTNQNNNSQQYESSSIDFSSFSLVLIAMAVGILLAIVILPFWAPNIAFSLVGPDPRAYWLLSRATAFVALGLFWISMALGLGITNKLAHIWPGGPTAFALHEYTSVLGLTSVLFHALFLLGDHYTNFSLFQLLVPFSPQSYQPFWVGIGQTGFYLSLIVTLSFYIRKKIGQKVWRGLHYITFLSYAGALIHGLMIGTDTSTIWAQRFYWISGISLMILFIYRMLYKLIPIDPSSSSRTTSGVVLSAAPVMIQNDQGK